MKYVWESGRMGLAVLGLGLLAVLGLVEHQDVGLHIAAIVIGVAGSNAYEKRGLAKDSRTLSNEE